MWDKTKAYKNNRTMKRGYDLMFENFFFTFFFMCQTQNSCTWKFRWGQGGAGAPSHPPLAPPLNETNCS